MEKSFNLWMVKVFVVTLLILLPTVIPVHAELPDQSIPIDQSLFITGLSSETATDSSGTYRRCEYPFERQFDRSEQKSTED